MKWKHDTGFYHNREFRVFREGHHKWCLSDIRNGLKAAPSWWYFSTAKNAKAAAEIVVKKPCGYDFGLKRTKKGS